MPIGPVPGGSMPMPGGQVPVIPSEPVTLNEEQHTKLSRELEVVSGNVRVMSEMPVSYTHLTLPTNHRV